MHKERLYFGETHSSTTYYMSYLIHFSEDQIGTASMAANAVA